ncbi:BTAD domain-containing putative transcriptional regulator [Streptomyces sp. NPDC086080]|uniref:BTAD domain-containing putative transcriptional regulator n=1 Tax=Streptomyces sp. NPDC086080 TaxID=3365748 RepID=UPI0037D78375
MSAHLAESNLCEALRHYDAYCRLLNDELGVGPSPRLVRMIPARSAGADRAGADRAGEPDGLRRRLG